MVERVQTRFLLSQSQYVALVQQRPMSNRFHYFLLLESEYMVGQFALMVKEYCELRPLWWQPKSVCPDFFRLHSICANRFLS